MILALYKKKGIDFIEDLNGIFAFALYDEEKEVYLIARDPIGVIPLYIGYDDKGHLMVSSELKGLEGFATLTNRSSPDLISIAKTVNSRDGTPVTGWITPT